MSAWCWSGSCCNLRDRPLPAERLPADIPEALRNYLRKQKRRALILQLGWGERPPRNGDDQKTEEPLKGLQDFFTFFPTSQDSRKD
jgi:hypothetical protein